MEPTLKSIPSKPREGTAVADAGEGEAALSTSRTAAAPAKRSKARVLLPIFAVGALLIGTIVYLLGVGKEATDDAQIEGRVIPVAARVQGQVAKVAVADNQRVEEGEILVELDKRDLTARLAAARADLASAKATLDVQEAQLALTQRNIDSMLKQARGALAQAQAGTGSSSASVEQARADLDAAESRAKLAGIELGRVKKLHDEGALAQAELDARQSQHDQAVASVAQAKARLDSARTGISSSGGQLTTAQGRLLAAETGPQQIAAARAVVATAEARVQQAQAALDLAELNLSYATVKAPRAGVVSRRNVELGQMVGPDRPLLALVPPDDVWVVANFKESQVAEMKPSQRVLVKVDAYGRRTFAAHVDSLAGAAGSRFALLPPDNSSGNFVKVVQRIPVLVRFDGDPGVTLRPGMSAEVTVYTK